MPSPAGNGKKEGAVAQEQAVVPSRRRVSFAPVAVPPPTHTKVPPSKRRWSLIRSLAKGKRLTSLTHEEDCLMRTLSSSSSSRDIERQSSADSSRADEAGKARQSLQKSIAVHKDMLTKAECDFLQDLIDTPDVAPEHFEHIHEVLCKDPLYHCEEAKEANKKEEKEDSSSSLGRRSSLLQYPSYRRELWIHLRSESRETSAETFAFTSTQNTAAEEKDQEVQEQAPPKEDAKRKNSKWGFLYNFQKALNLIDDRDKDDKTADLEEDDLDDDTTFCVLARTIHDFLDSPTVLTPPIMDGLRAFLPFAVQHDNFWLKFSLDDGASMYTLLNKIRNSARTFIAIETDQGDVFGSFTSSPWRIQPNGYYGSAEAFLWRLKKSRFTPCASVEEQVELESDVEVFEWSRHNRNIQSWTGINGQMTVGGGGYEDEPEKDAKKFGAGLTLSGDLSRGISEKCLTFNSPSLPTRSSDGVFNIMNLEVWTLTPVLTLEEAEKLELSRQFVFDHGGFCQ